MTENVDAQIGLASSGHFNDATNLRKEFLEEKYDKYNRIDFIELDPISIPHQFSQKEEKFKPIGP